MPLWGVGVSHWAMGSPLWGVGLASLSGTEFEPHDEVRGDGVLFVVVVVVRKLGSSTTVVTMWAMVMLPDAGLNCTAKFGRFRRLIGKLAKGFC